MRHIRVLICQVDDGTPDLMSDLACFDLATPDVATLQPETALDALEAATQETGHAILRRLLHAQWEQIDAALVARHCAQVAPAVVHQDGQETVTVASRFGLLHLSRQVCIDPRTQRPCAGWLGHPLAQRRHAPPKEAARSQRTDTLCLGVVSQAPSTAFERG